MLGIADRIDAPGLALHLAHGGELLERGDAGLVDHDILAVSHRLDAEGRAFRGNAGADDELDGLIFEDAAPVLDSRNVRIFLLEPVEQKALRVIADKLGAGGEQGIDLPEDVAVLDADDGEADIVHGMSGVVGFTATSFYLKSAIAATAATTTTFSAEERQFSRCTPSSLIGNGRAGVWRPACATARRAATQTFNAPANSA